MDKARLYIVCFIASLALFSCDEQRVFEKDIDFNGHEWLSSDTLEFSTQIEDLEAMNILINVRHRFDFNWRNAWLNFGIKFPNDSIHIMPVNVQLSQPDGQWYGDCSGDICRMQFPISKFSNYTFPDTGEYHFFLSHEMREDPLMEVMSAGIRIEKNKTTE